MKTACIYKITNVVTKQIYIGSTIDYIMRKQSHFNALIEERHCNRKLQRSFNKYGQENFVMQIIEIHKGSKELITREQLHLDLEKPYYNICKNARSKVGVSPNAETRLKLSLANLGKKMPQEQKDRISKTLKGRIITASHAAKIKQGLLNYNRRGRSEEHKANLLKVHIGNNWSKFRNA